MRLREDVRKQIAEQTEEAPSFTTIDDIYERFKSLGFEKEGVSRMLNSGIEWYGFGKRLKKRKPCAPYDRPNIDYEFSTELPQLTNMRFVVSLDDSPEIGDDTNSGSNHERGYARTNWTPFDALCAKEEEEDSENFYAKKQREYDLNKMKELGLAPNPTRD